MEHKNGKTHLERAGGGGKNRDLIYARGLKKGELGWEGGEGTTKANKIEVTVINVFSINTKRINRNQLHRQWA